LNSDKDYDIEGNYLQQEWTNSNQVTSQATLVSGTTVTLSSGTWPINCSKGRISFDEGSTWYDIGTRTNSTSIELAITATEATAAYDYIIRMSEFESGVIQLNQRTLGIGTDTTSPSSTVSASTVYSSYSAATAVDNNDDYFGWLATTTTGWWRVDFGTTKTIAKYRIYGRNNGGVIVLNNTMNSWQLQGSNDDLNWTTIDSVTGHSSWADLAWEDFTSFSGTPAAYRYYRINATANNGGSYIGFCQIELMESLFSNVITEPVTVVPTYANVVDISAWSDLNSVAKTETLNSQSIWYAMIRGAVGMTAYSNTNTEIVIWNATSGKWKKAVQYTGTVWQINTNTGTDNPMITWSNAAINDLNHAIAEAINSNFALQCTGPQLTAISDADLEQVSGSDTAGGINIGIHTQLTWAAILKSTSAAQSPSISQIRTNYDSVRASMDLRSKTYDPGFAPSENYVWSRIEHTDSDGPGIFYVSRNGGTEWTVAPITQQGLPLSGDIRIYRGTVDITSQTSGQDLRCRYQTAQGKDQFLHSSGLQAKS
jgi:hypothetical protein